MHLPIARVLHLLDAPLCRPIIEHIDAALRTHNTAVLLQMDIVIAAAATDGAPCVVPVRYEG